MTIHCKAPTMQALPLRQLYFMRKAFSLACKLLYFTRKAFYFTCKVFLCLIVAGSVVAAQDRPNLIWIMADDLGYGDLGCYGQQVIATPNLDRMAREGIRFSQFYAGATVCAPSRSVLMTGQHHGHTRVRGNAGAKNPTAQALRAEDVTVAKLLQTAGYRTALVGKWGLGDVGPAETGLPRKQGFDEFFGFLNQSHAHNHYPDFLWRNEQRETLPNQIVPVGNAGAGYATPDGAKVYADDLFADEAIRFVRDNQNRPFFLYWSMVIPHANNERSGKLGDGTEVPDLGVYADKSWPAQDKGQAAMISRMDSYVGRMLDELKRLKLDERTLVIFTSDNGPHNEARHDLTRFHPSGPLTGIKRSLTDGGIRVPFIAHWPGKIAAGSESRHVAYFGDWMATACELGQAPLPPQRDSLSFAPALLGKTAPAHEFLYWEFHEGGFSQAALYQGRWKGIRRKSPTAPLALYDLEQDIAEQKDCAADHPEMVAKIDTYLSQARSDSTDWPVPQTSSKP